MVSPTNNTTTPSSAKPKPKPNSKSKAVTKRSTPPPAKAKTSVSVRGGGTSSLSLWSRKRDVVYLGFFLVHVIVMLAIDLVPLYPTSLVPQRLLSLRRFYIETYHDQFFVSPPGWFIAYAWMEAVYHLPLSLWVIGGLWRDDPLVPLHLLIYAVQTALTTLTCIVDIVDWKNVPMQHKIELGKLYVPYLALSVFMGFDMFTRLKGRILGR